MRCMSCQYDLSNLSECRCSECGREFDPNDPITFEWFDDHRLRSALRWLWCSAACSALAMLFTVSMIAAVAARLNGNPLFMKLAHSCFSVLACCTPIIFLAQLIATIVAPIR